MDVQLLTKDLMTFAQPYIIPSAIVLAVTYGILQFFKRKKIKVADELKAAMPIVFCVVYHIVTKKPNNMYSAIDYIGVGIAHGAVLTSIYDMAIRRIKKKLHKED